MVYILDLISLINYISLWPVYITETISVHCLWLVVQLFDGNWWNKKDEKEEERDLARLIINKDKERLQDFFDDLQYEVDMDESYEE